MKVNSLKGNIILKKLNLKLLLVQSFSFYFLIFYFMFVYLHFRHLIPFEQVNHQIICLFRFARFFRICAIGHC